MTTTLVLLNIFITLALFSVIFIMSRKGVNFTGRILTALLFGVVLGLFLQFAYDASVIKQSISYIGLVGSAYVNALKMIAVPLIFTSICISIYKLGGGKKAGKIAVSIILILLITTAISAAVGGLVGSAFGLNANGFGPMSEAQIAAGKDTVTAASNFQSTSIGQQIVNIIPNNIVYAFSGQTASSALSVVLVAALFGIAMVGLKKYQKDNGEETFVDSFSGVVQGLNNIVLSIIDMILWCSPFAIISLLAKFLSSSPISSILSIGKFALAIYVAVFIMFIIHGIILAIYKVNPIQYYKKAFSALVFAFSSRSSAATLPINIKTQRDLLGVDEGIANISASFGLSIGQNGCAGIYPAMVAIMIAPIMNINPLSLNFLLPLILVTTLSSIGISGAGGGATLSTIVVLSVFNFPLEMVGILIAVEPIVDMARTALNVNGTMLSGLLTSKMLKEFNVETFSLNENKSNKAVSSK